MPDKAQDVRKGKTMVGYKVIWILLICVSFLASCVPMAKQTQCNEREAFNTLLRTCLPVMPSTSSFMKIENPSPTFTYSKYRGDSSPVVFTFTIFDPYQQLNTVEWERVYNGTPITFSPSHSSTRHELRPSDLATEIGIHIISVKLRDSTGTIAASHNFVLKINENPKPRITSQSPLPTLGTGSISPASPDILYSVTINNSGSTFPTADFYQTEWSLYKNGVPVLVPPVNVDFPDTNPVGVHTTSFNFDPDDPAYGVGAYLLRARVHNDAGETVDERQWVLSVAHPPLSRITGIEVVRNTGTNPVTTAYHGVAHNAPAATAYNFVPVSPPASPQSDFCIDFADENGVYADGQYIRVRYYLGGNPSHVYEGSTGPGKTKVCLTDIPNTHLGSVLFNNPSPTSPMSQEITARIYDASTGSEYTANDAVTTIVYPVKWLIDVRPQNSAPEVEFGPQDITCDPATSTASTMMACKVVSDTNFNVSIRLTADDFSYSPIDESNLDYTIELLKDGARVQYCTKSIPAMTADTTGPEYQCTLSVNSYDSNGPFDVTLPNYEIRAQINDNGSPLTPGTPSFSRTLTWQLDVEERNTAPRITSFAAGVGAVTEGNDITFSLVVEDDERDNGTYEIRSCLNPPACTTSLPLISGPITRSSAAVAYTVPTPLITKRLSEGFLLEFTIPLNYHTLPRGGSGPVTFVAIVRDAPHDPTVAALPSAPVYSAPVTVTNRNDPPVINTNLITPIPNTVRDVMVGVPFSISTSGPGTITDPSTEPRERPVRQQWYARTIAIADPTNFSPWEIITGADGPNLIWTPSLLRDQARHVQLVLCVEDREYITTPSPSIASPSVCNIASPWTFNVRNNLVQIQDMSVPGTTLAQSTVANGKEVVVWSDNVPVLFNGITSTAVYSASVGDDLRIYVKRSLVSTDGSIRTENATQLFAVFEAFPASAIAVGVKELSITGTANSLYIAYSAAKNTAPSSYFPQVRRLDISSGKTAPNFHAGKLGFDYDGLSVTNGCVPASECIITIPANGSTAPTIRFSPTAPISGSLTLTTSKGSVIMNFQASPNPAGTICSNCSGATKAQNVANTINASVAPEFMGLSAIQSGETVTIYGSLDKEYFDGSVATPGSIGRLTDQQGSIYVYGGQWYLPFINTALGGPSNSKLSYYSGNLDANLNEGTTSVTIVEPSASMGLTSIDSATRFSNTLVGNDLFIALTTKSGSIGKIFRVDPVTYGSFAPSRIIFPGRSVIGVDVSANANNVFVSARVLDSTIVPQGENNMVGVYAPDLTVRDEFALESTTNVNVINATEDLFKVASIASYKIIPYDIEARVVAVSRGTTPNYRMYMARFSDDGGVWKLDCGNCRTISSQGVEASPYVKIGIGPIRVKTVSPPYRLSTDGSVINQGIKDVLFMGMGQVDSMSTNPYLGVLNMEFETITTPALFLGTNPNEDYGLFRPSLITLD